MFTPIPAALGGLLLALGTSSLYLLSGRLMGCSTIVEDSLSLSPARRATLPVLLGMVAAALIAPKISGQDQGTDPLGGSDYLWVLLSGLVVGVGSKMGSGCTSGHLLVGVPRLATRSCIAAVTFCAAASATIYALDPLKPCLDRAGREVECWRAEEVDPAQAWRMGCYVLALAAALAALGSWTTTKTTTPPPPQQQAEGKRVTRSMASPAKPPAAAAAATAGPALTPSLVRLDLASFLAGLSFQSGLIFAGMTSPDKIPRFLSLGARDLAKFDPSLAVVLPVAMIPFGVVHALSSSRPKPVLAGKFAVSPVGIRTEAKVVLGSVIFGIGWGMLGVCPGTGVTTAVWGGTKGAAWMGSFLVGRKIAL